MLKILWFFLVILSLSVGIAQAQVTKKPHYFPDGYETVKSGEDQADNYYRMLTLKCFAEATNSKLINPDPIIREVKYGSRTVPYIFDIYRKGPQGKVFYYDACGQKEISQEQLEDSIRHFITKSEEAAKDVAPFFTDKLERFWGQLAKDTGIPMAELVKTLKEQDPVSNNSKITFAETLDVPKQQEWSDFLVEMHLSHIPESYLGLTYSDTGACFISPILMLADHVTGKPVRLGHELMHANREFQRMPYLNFFDFETMASVPSLLMPADRFFFMLHSYTKSLRPLIRVYFNLDLDRAEKEIFPITLAGNRVMDRAKFRLWEKEIEKVKVELLDIFRRIDDQLSLNRWYWFALHDKLGDNMAIFKIMFALTYEPTGLGGAKNTKKWVLIHKKEYQDDAVIAFAASGTNSSSEQNPATISPMLADYFASKGIDPDLFQRLAQSRNITIEMKNIGSLVKLALEMREGSVK